MSNSWTDARIQQLKALWASGLTAKEIAAILGGVTRNGVLGKVHRLGISERQLGYQQRKDRAAKKIRRMAAARINRPQSRAKPRPEIVRTDLPPPVPEFLGLEIWQLTGTSCRYPRGDSAPYLFCGQPAKEESPYCEYCHWVTHNFTPRPRPKERGSVSRFTQGWRAA